VEIKEQKSRNDGFLCVLRVLCGEGFDLFGHYVLMGILADC
jgi:hypothetical protein